MVDLGFGVYWSSMFSCGYPIFIRYSLTRSRWSPCSMICPFLWVPPQAQYVLSFCAMLCKSEFLSSIPSMMVVALPNFRVSRRMRIRCCSFSISPQTQRSLGNPHVEQTSAMTLNNEIISDIYKSFKRSRSVFQGWEDHFCIRGYLRVRHIKTFAFFVAKKGYIIYGFDIKKRMCPFWTL